MDEETLWPCQGQNREAWNPSSKAAIFKWLRDKHKRESQHRTPQTHETWQVSLTHLGSSLLP